MRLLKSRAECDHDGDKGYELIGDTVLCQDCYYNVQLQNERLLGPRHVGWWGS